MSEKPKLTKTILNSNKYWGLLMKVYMKELDESIVYKGYITNIAPIEGWFEERPVVHVTFTDTDKGSMQDVIGAEGNTYEWFFPLFSFKEDNEQRTQTLVANSGGYMDNIDFVEFETKKDMIEWVLDSEDFTNGKE